MYECNLIEDSNIVKLRELTRALEFGGIVHKASSAEIKELNMEQGVSYMVGLYKTPVIAVARNYASQGCKFPKHHHLEWELLIVYEGEMNLSVGGRAVNLTEKEFYYIDPGVEHEAFFPRETWFLAITMPASQSWPDGG